MTGGNPAYVDNRFEELKEKLPYYETELERKHPISQSRLSQNMDDYPQQILLKA